MTNLYTVHFFGGPKHRESMVTDLLPEIRFPVIGDINPRLALSDVIPTKTHCHVYERQIGTVDYIYKGIT
jgi:hypothetical protein